MRRNMGRRGNNNSGGKGPLMTGHLQDIDLELELLKRKREMIEQQQQLLVMEQQFQTSRHSYDQMRYDEPVQHGSNRDFAHLYETGPKHRAQFGRKRQAENQWQYDGAPKRTPQKKKNPPQLSMNQHGSGNKNFRPQKPHQGQGFNQGSKFSPRGPAPLMAVKVPKQSIGQKIANQKAPPKTASKDFTPSKVSKQKGAPAPNKLASLPVSERKSLVAAASKSSTDVSRMLLPDRVPSQQVSGRLELALGAIMKNIRALIIAQPQHASVLRSSHQQRVMKQTVRERIRTVMLGKVVGSLNEILAIYREEFPEETDADILNIALEAGGSAPDQNLSIKFIKTEDPGEFFKANMNTLLETHLNEMFSKLEELYAAPADDTPSQEQTNLENNKESDLENNKEIVLEMTKENDLENKEESELENKEESGLENKEEVGLENKEESELENKEESELENKEESELENKDESELENKAESELENKEESELENKEESELENNKEIELEKNKESDLEDKKEIGLEKNKGQTNVVLDLVKNREEHNKNREFTQEYKEFLNTTITVYDVKRVIPKLIKRYVPYIVKLMSFDTTYQNTKAIITKKANEKAAQMFGAGIKVVEHGQGDSTAAAAAAAATPKKSAAESRQFYNLPYYVKIMGRPSLPKRRVMQTFLSQFNPQTVKKHRTVHNLLFVGFNEKSDFDVIVGADGTVIGRNTLSIRICPKASGPKESNGENANDVSQGEVKAEQQKDGDIISPELDGQITDLLSSIRKSEEEDTAKENGVVNENNTGEDQAQAENNADDVEMEGEGDIENAGDEENIDENMTEENQEEEFSEDVETQNSEEAKETGEPEVTDDSNKEKNSQETNEEGTQKSSEKTPTKAGEQSDDKVGELKNVTGRSTPARTSARLANVTPSTIRTRRASRVAPQN